ncbi:hypothetical protein [Bradyrhizobium sp. LTSP885]|uniref:hypothetical protein n=1 Tax=Bradyrhizobium sp. LTSP885 TaxID=1619232 RepID=UPI000B15CCC5|nr:hypothetical protein [Bradyrhizobium sp. LTSP885]
MSYFNMLMHAKRQETASKVLGRHSDLLIVDDIPSGEDVMDQPDTISLDELARSERG